jgi:putative two-component system response regulator
VNNVPCVVVAGESADIRHDIASMLRDEPWLIVGAPDGQAVMDLVGSHRADLVLMESKPLGLDGIDVCHRLRLTSRDRLLPVVIISGVDDTATRVAALDAGADDFLSSPLERNELVARVRSLLRMKSMHDRLEDARQVILALAKAAEAKDHFTLEHAERVADNSSELARRIELVPDVLEQIRVGALIHDVGKIAIPDHVLNKNGPLSSEELALIKTHTVVGAEIVAPLAAQRHLVAIVRNHHERFDGAGYPDGLAGDSIPLGARIVAVADAYDAMVNDRPYRAALAPAIAIQNLMAGRNKQWDGNLVEVFVAIQEQR